MIRLRLLICFMLVGGLLYAQAPSLHFQRLTTEDGLTTGNISGFAQDKYGYIWIATFSGLNRYDGYGMRSYQQVQGDSNTLLSNRLRSLLSDDAGRLWVSSSDGLQRFDHATQQFTRVLSGFRVNTMVQSAPDTIWVATYRGLAILDPATRNVRFCAESRTGPAREWLSGQIYHLYQHESELYIHSNKGLLRYGLDTHQLERVEVPPQLSTGYVQSIAIDAEGWMWMAFADRPERILRTDRAFRNVKWYDDFRFPASGEEDNRVGSLFIDREQRLWALTVRTGLGLFDPANDRFHHFQNNPWLEHSLLTNHLIRIFQDREGRIWLGTEGYGVCRFDPNENLFETHLPAGQEQTAGAWQWARSVCEDPQGGLWMATAKGVWRMDPASGTQRHWQNLLGSPHRIYNNSVRSLLTDRQGTVWIGTASGMNRYFPKQDRMTFIGAADGLPQAFFWTIFQDSRDTIWLGSDAETYCYVPSSGRFVPVSEHPVLAPYAHLNCRTVLEDRSGLLWFGLNGRGLLCYDRKEGTVRHWEREEGAGNSLAGNFVIDLAEDARGRIWIATINGLSVYDPLSGVFSNKGFGTGLPSNRTTCLEIDNQGRIWIGTPVGLVLLEPNGQLIRQFDTRDGLPISEFSDMPAQTLRDGRFVFPTQRGFVLFHPNDYRPSSHAPPVFLSGVNVFNRAFKTPVEYEALEHLQLPPGQNFFSLELTALNYENNRHNWYAYKMEPYDRDWTYTQSRTATYTNVPGGDYTFRFKASADPNQWNVPEKSLQIRIETVWYRSGWFMTLCFIALFSAVAFTLRRRIQHRNALLRLERKAQALEKEKAIVQYENLTQQLNPHFLFNSLASLGSLIRFRPAQAGEFLESLSRMYRYILQNRERETVTVEEELAFTEHFIKLQQTRFGAALQVRIQVDKACTGRKLAPVTLQNLMENAIKHNAMDEDEPLVIEIFPEGCDYLVVRNNLRLKGFVETSNRQGLNKLQSLYGYLSDRPMRITQDEQHFTVKVPLL